MPLEMLDQRGAMALAVVGIADRIDLQRQVGEPERLPQPRQHDDLFGVDVGTGESQRLDVELVELAIAASLRTLVAEHLARYPHALRAFVDEVVLDRRAHDSRSRLGTQRQTVAGELV